GLFGVGSTPVRATAAEAVLAGAAPTPGRLRDAAAAAAAGLEPDGDLHASAGPGERPPLRAGGRGPDLPGRPPARALGAHRDARGLRARRLRGVHRPARRRADPELPHAGGPGGGPPADDRRGARAGRRPPSAPGGVLGASRPAVRVLHARHPDGGRGVPAGTPGAEPGGDPGDAGRPSLPLHGLPVDRRGDPRRRPLATPAGGRRRRVRAGRSVRLARETQRSTGASLSPATADPGRFAWSRRIAPSRARSCSWPTGPREPGAA